MEKQYDITGFGAAAGAAELQTGAIQAAFDACRTGGGTVIIPRGVFRSGGLRMYSDTELRLEAGAVLLGSDEREDYPIYDVPEGVALRTDMEMITHYYNDKPWPEYRRALISAYGEHDIAITGAKDSVIDGADCYDPDGEEHFRGPHLIFVTNCENVKLYGYTAQNSGNFMHQFDNCVNVTMRNVTCLAGHDGIHLHCCVNTVIEDCVFRTGDDCIAGINIENLLVRGCELNTSCDVFRMGGKNIAVENCDMHGPGYYPHRVTVVRGKNDVLPREAGRHNTLFVLEYFASESYPADAAYNIVFNGCKISGVDRFIHYEANSRPNIHAGTPFTGVSVRDTTFTGLIGDSAIHADPDAPLTFTVENVAGLGDFGAGYTNTRIIK